MKDRAPSPPVDPNPEESRPVHKQVRRYRWLGLTVLTGFAIATGFVTSNSITGETAKFRIIVQTVAPTFATSETSTTVSVPRPMGDPPIATEPTPPDSTSNSATPPAIRYEGSGDALVDLGPDNDRSYIVAAHNGRQNFMVKVLGVDVQPRSLAVNEIGPYLGTNLLVAYGDPAEVRYLQISADGDWMVELLDESQLPVITAPSFAGSGSTVVRYLGPRALFDVSHNGTSNFIVKVIDENSTELLVNQIGDYAGRQLLAKGPLVIVVRADGAWSFERPSG